jgi:hypothetical protein
MPGKKPASATPRRNRKTLRLRVPATNMVDADTIPQVIMMRAIQMRAPTLPRIRLLGTSNKLWPTKNMDVAKP